LPEKVDILTIITIIISIEMTNLWLKELLYARVNLHKHQSQNIPHSLCPSPAVWNETVMRGHVF